MERRAFLTMACGGLLAAPVAAEGQSGAGPRVGFLGVTSETGYARQVRALREGFRDLGYIEGQNIVIEYRWAQGQYDRLPALAAELIRLQPDVIVTSGPGTRVVKEATTTIPIVMAVGGDAVASGLVASLARPGGNITGSTFFGPELSAKRLELLKEAVPRLARVAVLVNPVIDFVYTVDQRSNQVSQFNYSPVTAALTALSPAAVSTASNPAGGGITGDGTVVVVANNGSSNMSVFKVNQPPASGATSTATGKLVPGSQPTVSLTGQPSALLVR